ncbi:hypothetical protein [Candidatus Phytoplasma solani]|uniref:hypothetical protein n=1 Tax=Candidatus Phytoplasma solani TaxID=69896 RepID=UPI00358FF745
MKIQTKNKIFTTLVVFICSLVVLGSLVAITNYFSKRKTEPIQLANEIPIFEVERTGGNNTEKSLLPIPITNLNKNKYAHLITIDHKAIFNPNGIELGEPLYLKIATRYDTHNTFAKPEQFFNLSIKVAGVEYNDATRPKMTEKGETKETQRNIKISIEQRDLITNKNPKLDLIIDYELVDSKGNGFGGGSQTIENKTTQQTTPNTNDTTHTPLTHHTHGTSALNPLQKLSLENVTFAAFGNKELQKSPTQNQSLLDPYLTYPTHEGDIIREYRLFPNMVPTQKDHADRTNYFERQDFEDMMNKYDLKTFPTRWTNGRENLYNLEYENGKRKTNHDWTVSKANYSLIQTNQPNNSPEMMTQDIEGANGFWNKSDCFFEYHTKH